MRVQDLVVLGFGFRDHQMLCPELGNPPDLMTTGPCGLSPTSTKPKKPQTLNPKAALNPED